MNTIKIIECPRDAMQGWPSFIPTEKKINYINSLLKVGFDTIDFGSFVSPKAIPQMADTKEVLKKLELDNSSSKLLAIIANKRGAEEAAFFEQISYLGFPFSISETFQQRNANSTISDAYKQVEEIQEIGGKHNKELVVYISMAFGNPYGDIYNEDLVYHWMQKLVSLGVNTISLADTVGLATPEQINSITKYVINEFSKIETGVHLHSAPLLWKEKLEAARNAGCNRFDGALKGIGGCPMAGNDLIGNINTEQMLTYFIEQNAVGNINEYALLNAIKLAEETFV